MPADGRPFIDYHATPATALRRGGGIDGDYPATGACCLVRQDDEEGAPPRVTHRLGQMVMLHQVGGLEVLVTDRVVLAYQRQRRLVVEVLSLASHPLMRLGQQGHRLAPRHTSVRGLEGALGLSVPARIEDAGPIRQGGE